MLISFRLQPEAQSVKSAVILPKRSAGVIQIGAMIGLSIPATGLLLAYDKKTQPLD